jgi:hypothetical protein
MIKCGMCKETFENTMIRDNHRHLCLIKCGINMSLQYLEIHGEVALKEFKAFEKLNSEDLEVYIKKIYKDAERLKRLKKCIEVSHLLESIEN